MLNLLSSLILVYFAIVKSTDESMHIESSNSTHNTPYNSKTNKNMSSRINRFFKRCWNRILRRNTNNGHLKIQLENMDQLDMKYVRIDHVVIIILINHL